MYNTDDQRNPHDLHYHLDPTTSLATTILISLYSSTKSLHDIFHDVTQPSKAPKTQNSNTINFYAFAINVHARHPSTINIRSKHFGTADQELGLRLKTYWYASGT